MFYESLCNSVEQIYVHIFKTTIKFSKYKYYQKFYMFSVGHTRVRTKIV